MKRLSIAVALAVLAGATTSAAPTLASPSRAAKPGRANLAGTNIISGRSGGVIDVHIPTPAVWTGETDEVTIEGGGELPGFILVRSKTSTYDHPVLGPIESTYDEVVAAGIRLPAAGVTKSLSRGSRTLLLMPFKDTLKPGNYRLYLLADRTPVTVTLKLEGLVGTTRLSPTKRTGLDMKELPERSRTDSAAMSLFTAGDDAELEKPGLVVDATVVEIHDGTDTEFGSCVYRGEPIDEEQGQVVSYAPYCAGGTGRDYVQSFIQMTGPGGKRIGVSYGIVPSLDADDWTISNWYRGSGTIGKAASYGAWLNLS